MCVHKEAAGDANCVMVRLSEDPETEHYFMIADEHRNVYVIVMKGSSVYYSNDGKLLSNSQHAVPMNFEGKGKTMTLMFTLEKKNKLLLKKQTETEEIYLHRN
jgi:hypothetical protein